MSSLKVLFYITLLVISNVSYATCGNISCTGKVSFMYIDSEKIRLAMDQDMRQLDCNLSSGKYIVLEPEHPFADHIYKALLAAHVSRNPQVTVRISDLSNECQVAYITTRTSDDWAPPTTGNPQPKPHPNPINEPDICLKNPKKCDEDGNKPF